MTLFLCVMTTPENANVERDDPMADKAIKSSRKMGIGQRWSQVSLPNKINVGLTVVIVVLTAVNVFFFVKQVKDQDAQVAQVTNAIVTGINNAKTATERMIDQNESSLRAVLEENRKALRSAEEQSRISLRASIEASRLDQRAWVGVTSVTLPECSDGTKPVFFYAGCASRLGVNVENLGRSIARKYSLRAGAYIGESGLSVKPVYGPISDSSVTVLFPRMTVSTYTPPFGNPTNEDQVTALRSGRATLFFFGEITYEDVSGTKRQTTFCFRLTKDLAGMVSCGSYNEAN
ncbi:MAG: hypothetical protein NTV52_33665 [Acidobacteria bacterium]|nr:hypothetical protein [Acidobacteriota bacterium]